MAKPNYSFEKRKKELDRIKKKEEKKARKSEKNEDGSEIAVDDGESETAAATDE